MALEALWSAAALEAVLCWLVAVAAFWSAAEPGVLLVAAWPLWSEVAVEPTGCEYGEEAAEPAAALLLGEAAAEAVSVLEGAV